VGLWLGAVIVATVAIIVAATEAASAWGAGVGPASRAPLGWELLGVVVVFAVGLYDDYRPSRTRGIARQLSLLVRGRVTSGIVKLVVIVAASFGLAWALGARGGTLVLDAAVLAGSANLWNLLDVAPGRSIKMFAPVALALAATTAAADARTVLLATAGAALVALPADLRESAMLGDGGANVLGFVVGIGLVRTLGTPWLGAVLAGIVALHAVSETLTLSRAIRAVPPLRWYDALGRVAENEDEDGDEGADGP
jgi:hypothetical protein